MVIDLVWTKVDPDTSLPLLWEQPGQKTMMRCPWCEMWGPKDSFVALLTPPGYTPPRVAQVYKHARRGGCGMVFALGFDAMNLEEASS